MEFSLAPSTSLPSCQVLLDRAKCRPSFLSRTRVKLAQPDEQKTAREEVYVGDGKVILDDPKKYPSKEDAGLLQGATGGWAGGEPGLKKFMDTIEPDEVITMKNGDTAMEPRSTKKVGQGNDKIYVGFDYKNETDMTAKERGEQGNFVIDDKNKYPDRDYIGWFPLQGGFAGGELGLKKFLEEGDIKIRSSDEKGRSQMSPIIIGIFVAAVTTTGGLLLTDAIDFGENLINVTPDQSPLDEKTKLLLEAAVSLLALTWAGGFVFALIKTAKERLDASAAAAQRLTISVGFWALVLFITYNLARS